MLIVSYSTEQATPVLGIFGNRRLVRLRSFDRLYDYLTEVRYPQFPEKHLAREYARDVTSLVLENEAGRIDAWFGFRGVDEVQLAIAVRQQLKGRWATKGLCEAILGDAFREGAKTVFVDTDKVALARVAGFKPRSDSILPNGKVRLFLNREDYLRKYGMRGKSV